MNLIDEVTASIKVNEFEIDDLRHAIELCARQGITCHNGLTMFLKKLDAAKARCEAKHRKREKYGIFT